MSDKLVMAVLFFPMKIGYYHTTPFPSLRADHVHVVQMCRSMAQLGHEVTLYIPRLDKFANDGEALHEAKKMFGDPLGFDCMFIPRLTIFGKLQTLGSTWGARNALKKANLDLIYSREPWACAFLPGIKKPFIFEAHDFVFHKRSKLINSFLERSARKASQDKNCKLFVTISEALKGVWSGLGVPPEKLFAAHDAVDLKMFTNTLSKSEAKTQLGLQNTRPVIIYTGSLFEDRGIELILQAAQRLPQADFYLIGGAKADLERCKIEAKQFGLANLIFTGQLPHHVIPIWQAAADILLMMWTWRVPTMKICSPMKLFEYMAAQRLIVGPNFPTIAEVLEDGKDAILFEADNLEAMVKALQKGLNDFNHSTLPAAARRKVEEEYTWLIRCERILKQAAM